MLRYELLARDPVDRARRGRLHTARGTVETPAFMPVGTQAAVKSALPEEVAATGAEVVLGNTYHLFLRPGHRRIERLGGLHRFMGWDRSILTDSGGFQVFSLASLSRLDDRGVEFRSHVDGTRHRLTPELSMEIQYCLGSDVAMVLDDCPPWTDDERRVAQAVDRTTRWAERSRAAWHSLGAEGALFGIVQGGRFETLRRRSADALLELDLPGYAIGGVSVGEPREQARAQVEMTAPWLPDERPRYLMGVGYPADILHAVSQGIDLFDCVLPTRNARHGMLFTRSGRVNIKRAAYAEDDRPLDARCGCPTCARFSRAYLRHLFKAGETLGAHLATLHNLTFYQDLMRAIREAISTGGLHQLDPSWRVESAEPVSS